MKLSQQVIQLNSTPALDPLWHYLDEVLDDIIAEATTIQQIPAPTFNEYVRANHVLSRFGNCGLVDTGIDEAYNAYGRMPGQDPNLPAILISAHTDTVFDADTDLTIRREEDGRIYGPGLGDNSLGVAAIIALADILRQFSIRPHVDIWFVATSREEGLGNLDGIRAFFEREGKSLGTGIILEGMALGHICHAALPSRRLRISFYTEGGHSWLHFGRPNAIHEMARLCTRITELAPPQEPRTTFNIGLIEGGNSINSLAAEASFCLDLRSEDPDALAALEAEINAIIADHRREDARIEVEVVGDRPAGAIAPGHDLVLAAQESLKSVEVESILKIGSTDGSLLLANGVPAVTVGVATGGNAHRLDEYIDPTLLPKGMKHLILLTLAVAGWEPSE